MKGVPQARVERDWCLCRNAPILAKRIEKYWEMRGRRVGVSAVPAEGRKGCDIRSNIISVLGITWR